MPINEVNALVQLSYLYNTHGFPFLRYGQFFVGRFIKKPWPELFYETDNIKASIMINKWLKDNQYTDKLPIPVYRIEDKNGHMRL